MYSPSYYLLTLSYTQFPLRKVNGILVELYERCELVAQNSLPMAVVIHFLQRSLQRNIGPLNIGMAHSIQWTFLQHSEQITNDMGYTNLLFLSWEPMTWTEVVCPTC